MKKRILALLMCLCLCVSLLPMAALADGTTTGLRLGFMGEANINPGDNFGAGGNNLADGSGGSHPVGVYVDGVATSNFTVTSSEESVCTVAQDGTYIWVTNVSYGTSVLTVSAGGYTEQFNWVNDPGPGEGGESDGDGGDDSGTGDQNGFTVTPTFNYPNGITSGGAIRVLNADGSTTDYADGEVVNMAAGETCRFIVLPLEDGTEGFWNSMSGAMPGEETIDGVTYTTIAGQDTTVEITYGVPGTGGDDGPGPVSEDFDVVINVDLPEDYEGDGKVVSRMDRDENYNFVSFGDGAVYGDGDTVSVKAGEWALFGAAPMDGYVVEYIFNNASSCGTMGEGPESSARYAVIDGLAEGASAVELNVVYVALDGIMIEWFGLVLSPGAGFGNGALGDYEIPVLYDGEQISDFTVTSSNEDVCTVTKNDNGVIVLTAVGYGDSTLTITANGESAEFNWHCENDGGSGGEGEGPMGPVVSEDDYEIVFELGYEGFAEDELVGGGIVVFDGDGNYVGTYTESTTIPVSGGTKFLFRPIHAYGSDHNIEGISGTENGCYACYDDSTLRMVYTSCGTGNTESIIAPESDYTVDFEVVYDGFEPGMGFGGGIVVFDENGDYVATYTENQSIAVPGGTALLFQEIPIVGAYSSLEGKQGEYGRMGIRSEAGSLVMVYTAGEGEDPGGDGGDYMGPPPAAMDFDVVIRVELPEDYEGDGKVVTRMDVDENGNVIASDDSTLYGDDDTISVKAGEWAVFGAAAIDGYAVEYIFNNAASFGTMNPDGSTRYAQIESVDYGDAPVELIVEYVSTAGITLNWYDSILRPDTGFGVGGLGVTETLCVLYDGEQVSDFTVTNENDDVCTVSVENGVIVLNAVGYGESVLTVTANGETARFTWVCDHGITINYVGSGSFIPAGADIGGEPGNYEMEVRVHGEVIDDFDVYSSDENVCVVNKDGATLIINCVGSGRCNIAIEYNGITVEYTWICEESPYKGITLAPEDAELEAIPAGARFGMPVWGEYRYRVRLDTFFVGDFTVTSDNTDLCEVRSEGGYLVVNSKGYGETPIHITVGDTTVEYTWVCMEPAMSVKPPEAGAPITDEALNGEDVDFAVSADGQTVEISGTTASGDESHVRVETEDAGAIVDALEDENVTVGIVFGSMDINPEDISEPDLDAANEYAAGLIDEEKGERITALTIVDIFAELATVYPDRPGERLGSVKELNEGIDFSMTVKKDALREQGRDVRHLTVIHVHDGEAYTAWEYSEDYYYEETEDSYILHFEVNRFSPFILAYDWVVGDIDGDDKPAEPTDLIRMMKFIAGEGVTVVPDSVDVNRDNHVDILDVIRLMRVIAGEDVPLL